MSIKTSSSASSLSREGAHVAEMQRRRLLLAFGEVLAEGGLETATVGRVCKRAGVSRRTFYELYEDREDCFVSAFGQGTDRLSVEVLRAYEQGGKWQERVRAALAVILEAFDQDPGFARMCMVESLKGGSSILERRRSLLQALESGVDRGRNEAKAAVQAPPLTGQGVVGGVAAVIYSRLLESDGLPFIELLGPLMGMIVHPYLGASAAAKELEKKPPRLLRAVPAVRDPFKDLPIRFTYRTARVLAMIASTPGTSNRAIATTSGITDEGQMSRLLRRLQSCELIENRSSGQQRGEPNAWMLTERGRAIHSAIAERAAPPAEG
jgi:AcrR family transcriptional regulator